MGSNIKINRICQHCGTQFVAKTTVTKFCSQKCASKDYKRRQREKKIKQSNDETKTLITQPLLEIKEKSYLSIKEVCLLTGLSRTTLWRMHKNRVLVPGLFNSRKLYRKDDIEKLFGNIDPICESNEEVHEQRDINDYSLDELYSLSQVYKLYNVKPEGLYRILIRNSVPKKRIGKEVFVPMEDIIQIFNT